MQCSSSAQAQAVRLSDAVCAHVGTATLASKTSCASEDGRARLYRASGAAASIDGGRCISWGEVEAL